MARPVHVLSLLTRLGSLSLTPTRSAYSCRFASRYADRSWSGPSRERSDRTPRDRVEAFDVDPEDVEEKLQEVVAEEMKRQKILKFNILRKKMNPSGAPERKLTWEAMDQIRYLKKEQPEEWTVERLAEGYSVTPDVILRVLRSKFVPSPQRKSRQDANVMSRLGHPMLPSGARPGQDKLKLLEHRAQAALPAGSRESGLVPVADGSLMIRGKGSTSLAKSPTPSAVLASRVTADNRKDTTVTVRGEDCSSSTDPAEDHMTSISELQEETWDGCVLSEKEIEQLMDTVKASPVIQIGNVFKDAEGNFLYRI